MRYLTAKLPLKVNINIAHPLACHNTLSIEQLKDVPIITTLVSHSVTSHAIEQLYYSHGYQPNFQFRVSQKITISSLLEHNMGIFFSPFELQSHDNNIISVPLAQPFHILVGIIGNTHTPLTAPSIAMLSALKTLPIFSTDAS